MPTLQQLGIAAAKRTKLAVNPAAGWQALSALGRAAMPAAGAARAPSLLSRLGGLLGRSPLVAGGVGGLGGMALGGSMAGGSPPAPPAPPPQGGLQQLGTLAQSPAQPASPAASVGADLMQGDEGSTLQGSLNASPQATNFAPPDPRGMEASYSSFRNTNI